jgi:hypothetical protein
MPGRFCNQEEVRSRFPICFQSRPVPWHQCRNNSMLLAYDALLKMTFRALRNVSEAFRATGDYFW